MGDRKLPSTSDPAVTMVLAGKLKASEAENVRLRAEVERLGSERFDAEVLAEQRRLEVERLRSAVRRALEKCSYQRPGSASVILRDALAQEDGAG